MRQSISRASLLRGRLRGGPPPLRPPWALAEPAFLEACTRCDACRAACPEGILVRGSGGFPLVDFQRGECTFCGRCAAACEDGALTRPQGTAAGAPWDAVALVGAGCLARKGIVCRSCEDACEPRAIRFAVGPPAAPQIDLGACTGCGACVAPCPVDAIEIQRSSEVTT